MDKLAANPLKFILFIDDLSFAANDGQLCRPQGHFWRAAPAAAPTTSRSTPPPTAATWSRRPSPTARRRPARGRHPPGADEPVGPLRPDRHLPAARQGAVQPDPSGGWPNSTSCPSLRPADYPGRSLRHPRRRPQPPRRPPVSSSSAAPGCCKGRPSYKKYDSKEKSSLFRHPLRKRELFHFYPFRQSGRPKTGKINPERYTFPDEAKQKFSVLNYNTISSHIQCKIFHLSSKNLRPELYTFPDAGQKFNILQGG